MLDFPFVRVLGEERLRNFVVQVARQDIVGDVAGADHFEVGQESLVYVFDHEDADSVLVGQPLDRDRLAPAVGGQEVAVVAEDDVRFITLDVHHELPHLSLNRLVPCLQSYVMFGIVEPVVEIYFPRADGRLFEAVVHLAVKTKAIPHQDVE
jgi:hypothetical protein